MLICMLTIGRYIVNHETDSACYLPMAKKNPAAVALGRMTSAKKAAAARRNAKKSLAARMKLTEEQRSAIARKAAETRWGKKH